MSRYFDQWTKYISDQRTEQVKHKQDANTRFTSATQRTCMRAKT